MQPVNCLERRDFGHYLPAGNATKFDNGVPLGCTSSGQALRKNWEP